MKKILLLISVLSLFINSCDNFLTKEPQAQISTSNAYKSPVDAEKAVTAAYTQLTANNWCCSYVGTGYMYWVLGNVASDDAAKGGESGSDQTYAKQVSLFNIPADNDAVRFAWSSQYIGIHRANLVLDNIPDIDMDEDLKNRYLAEAKFLRAFYYINLVRSFGGVPIVLSSDIQEYDKKRASKEEVYNQIIKDLKDASEVLPQANEYSAEDRGRATKGAAEAYLGKIYLYMHDYTNAEEWFGKVINSGQYSLDPYYSHLFRVAGEDSPEQIFQVQFYNSSTASDPVENYQDGQIQGSRARLGWGFNCPTQDFVDAFEDGDPRLKASVYQTGDTMPDGETADVGNSPTGYMNKKAYVTDDELVNGTLQAGKDMLLMRLGKVLLWYAEAANENGHTTEALDALNKVRERAREGDSSVLPGITETAKDALKKIIWHEERVEFGQEYERFFELVREGRAGDVLRAYAQKYNTSKGAGFKDGVNEILPIPLTEINLSAGLIEQNPGY